jgi:hypothetical protein
MWRRTRPWRASCSNQSRRSRAEGDDADELRDEEVFRLGEAAGEEEAQERCCPVKVAVAAEVRRRRQALQTAEQRIRAAHLCGVTRRRI